MKLFSGWITIAVKNVDAAAQWYAQKFDLKNEGVTQEEGMSRACELMSRDRDMETKILLCEKENDDAELDRPILNTANAAKARDWLLARGVEVGPVQTDRQGTRYIEMRDCEGNMVEICEEPGY